MVETSILIGLAIIGFMVLVFAGWVIAGYNRLVSGKVNIETQWSNIKTEYQRRADLFYNLAEAVKSFKKHEKETLTDVIKARNEAFFQGSKLEQAQKMKKLDSSFSKLLLLFERYPRLKAGKRYKDLMNEVRITEDRINVARTDYNDIVRSYNTYVQSFPSNILASMFSYRQERFFMNEPKTDKAPKMSL